MSLFRPRWKDTDKATGAVTVKVSKFWWYEFYFQGQKIRRSTGVTAKTIAKRMMDDARRDLEKGLAGIKKPEPAKLFSVAAQAYLVAKRNDVTLGQFAPSSLEIETLNLSHLLPVFGNRLLIDIEGREFTSYQVARAKEPLRARGKKYQTPMTGKLTSPSTINLELATFRAIMNMHGQWDRMKKQIKAFKVSEDIGLALSHEQEKALIQACSLSRSLALLPFVTLAIDTGARKNVLLKLQWRNIDFVHREVKFGKDKTDAGSDRKVPLSPRAFETVKFWAETFPHRKPTDYVFPHQRYGGGGKKDHFGFTCGMSYDLDVTKPMADLDEAFDKAKLRAAQILKNDPTCTEPLICRFHDLRHTAVSRMDESGVSLRVIAKIVGWSMARTAHIVELLKRYSHPSDDAMRRAVEAISKQSVQGFQSPVFPSRTN